MKHNNMIGRILFCLALLSLHPAVSAQMDDSGSATVAVQAPEAPEAPEAAAGAVPNPQVWPELIPTDAFAGRSVFKKFGMAPDGAHFAVLRVEDKDQKIQIFDAETLEKTEEWAFGERVTVDWFRWVGNDRLIAAASSPAYRFGSRRQFGALHVREIGTGEAIQIPMNNRGWLLGNIVHLAEDGSHALISMQELPNEYPAVYRFDITRGGLSGSVAPTKVIGQQKGVWRWHADDAGVVRLGLGWFKKRLQVYYRPDSDSKFKLIGKLRPEDEDSRYWEVIQIVQGSDKGYVLEEGPTGRVGIRLFDYLTARTISTFYEHPVWDVDAMWIGDDGEPLAAFYTDNRERVVWFDKEYEAIYSDITTKLVASDMNFVARSDDNKRILLWAGDEANPGGLYVYSGADASLKKFADYRPELNVGILTKPVPIEYTARDGLRIPAYLTLPVVNSPTNLPLIILPHGGPYGVRDSLTYNDEVQFLANRGYAVLQPNYRGSGGYGKPFADLGSGQIGRKMQDDLDDAMDWAVGQGIADPKRVCVVGGSYGGYAALWAVLRNPERYRCAASWAGVTDFEAILKYDRLFLSRAASREWREQVRGSNGFDIATVSPISRAESLNRPVLLAHGMNDSVVPFDQYRAFEAAANDASVKIMKLPLSDEGHSFSSAKNEKKWYDALEHFLDQHNPARQTQISDGEVD